MNNEFVRLEPLLEDDREQFIRDNQDAFNYGAMEEFGLRDNHFEEDGEIISKETIEQSIDSGTAYRIMCDGEKVGGLVVKVDGENGELELLFVRPDCHTKGIGYAAWCAIEEMYPKVRKWETCTPYFEQRNIHFYINKCGFQAVEFFNKFHMDPNDSDVEQMPDTSQEDNFDGMFRFVKIMGQEKW